MSAHTPIIKSIIEGCGYKSYLELGVYDGQNFLQCSATCDFAVAVDRTLPNILRTQTDNRRSFQCTTEDFFTSQIGSLYSEHQKFDAIFIDACHDYQFVLKDLEESFGCLTEYGTIFLHDTSPAEERLLDPGYCGDAWRIHANLKNIGTAVYGFGYNFVTLPCAEAGLSLVTKRCYRHEKFTNSTSLTRPTTSSK